MNAAELIIINYFKHTEAHAEECIKATPGDAEQAVDGDLRAIQESARWAVRMIIVQKILLEAFRETKETSSLDNEGLIDVASRKISTPGFSEKIIADLQKIGMIQERRTPRLHDISVSVRTSFAVVERHLRSEIKEKPERRRVA